MAYIAIASETLAWLLLQTRVGDSGLPDSSYYDCEWDSCVATSPNSRRRRFLSPTAGADIASLVILCCDLKSF
jgi:hypothetical protein